MILSETNIQSFIIKVWTEEVPEEGGDAPAEQKAAGPVRWRGHITHVISGKQIYFEHLEQIESFMEPYLKIGPA